MLNPEFWLDEDVATTSAYARLLYMGLWGICDDNYATLPDKQAWIKIQVFPYEDVNIQELLTELESIGKILKFTSGNKNYWYLKNFLKHQTINRPSKPKYPEFRGSLTEYSRTTQPELKEGKEKKEEGILKIQEIRKAHPPKRL